MGQMVSFALILKRSFLWNKVLEARIKYTNTRNKGCSPGILGECYQGCCHKGREVSQCLLAGQTCPTLDGFSG